MSLLPDYKDIVELLKKGLTLEAQEKIMQLRVGALELQEENLKLREGIKQLEGELTLAKDLTFEPNTGLYWLSKLDSSRDGPYCSVCYDKEKKLVRLHDGRDRPGASRWLCLICGSDFNP
jgi:hypothetical protein